MRLTILCGFLLFLFACSKNQWKQPTDINFDIALSSTQFLNGDLALHTGYLNLGSFVFDGSREEGMDVFFDTDYKESVEVPFKGMLTTNTKKALMFEVPQGTYDKMKVYLGTMEKPSSLVLEGEWAGGSSVPIFVRIELEGVEQWEIVVKNKARREESLELGSEKTSAIIILQPHTWITEIQRSMWEGAETVVLNGRTTLLINSDTNVELHRNISKLFLDSNPFAFVEP